MKRFLSYLFLIFPISLMAQFSGNGPLGPTNGLWYWGTNVSGVQGRGMLNTNFLYIANQLTTPPDTNLYSTRAWVTNRELAINVRDLGAVGDGVTDDTAAIQVAFNLASNTNRPGSVFIPAGIYLLSSSLFPPPAIHVFGEGKLDNDQSGQFTNFLHNASILKAWSNFPAIVVSNATHVRFENFQISGFSNPVQNVRYDFLPNSTNTNLYSSSFGIVTTNSSSFEGGHMRLEQVAINGFRTAFLANKLWDSEFSGVHFSGNEVGFQGIDTIDAATFINCNFGWHSNGVGLVFNGGDTARGIEIISSDSGNMMQFLRGTNVMIKISSGNQEAYKHSTNNPLFQITGNNSRLIVENVNFQTVSNYAMVGGIGNSTPSIHLRNNTVRADAFSYPFAGMPLLLDAGSTVEKVIIEGTRGVRYYTAGIYQGASFESPGYIYGSVSAQPRSETNNPWLNHGRFFMRSKGNATAEYPATIAKTAQNGTNFTLLSMVTMADTTHDVLLPLNNATITNLNLGALTNATLSTNSGVTNLNISINGTTRRIPLEAEGVFATKSELTTVSNLLDLKLNTSGGNADAIFAIHNMGWNSGDSTVTLSGGSTFNLFGSGGIIFDNGADPVHGIYDNGNGFYFSDDVSAKMYYTGRQIYFTNGAPRSATAPTHAQDLVRLGDILNGKRETWILYTTGVTNSATVGTNLVMIVPFNCSIETNNAMISFNRHIVGTGSQTRLEICTNGVSIMSTPFHIDAGESNSLSAATNFVFSTTNLLRGSYLEVKTLQVGATIPGSGLHVALPIKETP